MLGRSVRGRPIAAYELGDRTKSVAGLVVGCIHGNEGAGIAVARLLIRSWPAGAPHIWVVPDLNPDGHAARTRQNADGVDLNRNFPWRWRPFARRGDLEYPGPRPLSEPESRLAHALVLRVRPRVSVWFHQPLDVVDLSGGSRTLERRFARRAGLRVRRLARPPGSVSSWQNHHFPGTTAFVVELPPGHLRASLRERLGRAVDDLVHGVSG